MRWSRMDWYGLGDGAGWIGMDWVMDWDGLGRIGMDRDRLRWIGIDRN